MVRYEGLLKRVSVSLLYDVYGPLLTARQRQVYELHDHEDLSLSEIADDLGVSRQGVSDQLGRSRQRLEELESQLGFCRRLEMIEKALLKVQSHIDGNPSALTALNHALAVCRKEEEEDV